MEFSDREEVKKHIHSAYSKFFVYICVYIYYIILCYAIYMYIYICMYNTPISNYCFMLVGTQSIMLNTVFEPTK